MRKKKVLIYIDDDLYIRNYFTYNAFALPDFEVVIYANKSISQKYLLEDRDDFQGYIYDSPKRAGFRNLQSVIQLLKYINLSKSFKFRFNRNSKKGKLFFKVLSLPVIRNFTNFYIKISLRENKSIKDVILNEKPNLVVIPSQVVGSISLDIIEICDKAKIPTLCLIDGWDNISSKTIFPILPTYLAVWGEQSVRHAVDIQGFNKNKIFKIGTPRFDSYLEKINLKPIYDFKYVVFTGCAIAFDEISALKALDYILTKNNIKDVKIVYRPHPWRHPRACFDYFIEEDFKNVILDKQMAGYYFCGKNGGATKDTQLQPPLDYYPRLLNYCEFVVSPLTTMIIESIVMNKKVLVLAYDDGIHFTNPLNALKNYEHFDNIEDIPSFNFCYDYKTLPNVFIEMISVPTMKQNLKEDINDIINIDNTKYADRLNKVVDNILTTKRPNVW